jgi:LPS-assembly lipoprotein
MLRNSLLLIFIATLAACGFHLRGVAGTYSFPFKTVLINCDTPVICPGFKNTIKAESLTTIVTNKESAEVVIAVSNEKTSRDTLDFNSVGQIASYILTYQITARIYNQTGDQLGNDIVVQNQQVMAYNNSLILSAQQQEENTWDQIHQNVINALIRRIVYFHDVPLVSPAYAPESR